MNNRRLNADNVKVELVSGKDSLFLTDYGMTELSWESRDEIEVWTPFNKLTPESRIINSGYDLSFSFKKEMMFRIMDLFIAQQSIFLGQLPNNRNFGVDLIKENTQILEQNRSSDDKDKAGESDSMFNNNGNVHYVSPKYDIVISVLHPFILDGDEKRLEKLVFKEAVLYKPTFKTGENSADLEESVKGFSSYVQRDAKWNDLLSQIPLRNVKDQFDTNKITPESMPYLKRVITNKPKSKFLSGS